MRVEGVLKDLVLQTPRLCSAHENIAIFSQPVFDPAERSLHTRANLDQPPAAVAYPLIKNVLPELLAIGGDQADIQRRGIDRAVIRHVPQALNWRSVQLGHGAVLVQNPPGLLFRPRVFSHALQRGEATDRGTRDSR